MGINMFDILGPITIGPSSSHTAGAVRIGLVCRTILGGDVKKAKITFFGSFAETYRGHGTDKAVIGGLLGFNTNNEKIRESLRLAEFRGMQFEITTSDESRYHPNTVLIEASSKEKSLRLRGESIGGGAINISEINGFAIQASCIYDTVIIFHHDAQGILAAIAYNLSEAGYNIGNLRLSRTKRDGDVITVVETDAKVDEETIGKLKEINNVSDVVAVPKF